MIPWLYLKGISTGGFSEALQSLLGAECPGLSATTITRLKETWEEEFRTWNGRSLEGRQYVYVWADGVHFNIRLEEDRQCILVLMGVTPEADQGERQSDRLPHDGLQAHAVRREEMANLQRYRNLARRYRRSSIQRRYQNFPSRRLKCNLHQQHLTISRVNGLVMSFNANWAIGLLG